MPGKEQLADIRQKLEQLNRLEEEGSAVLRADRSTLDSEALIESLRANLPLSVLVQHDRLRTKGRRSIAELRRGVCSACHMSLPVGAQSEVKRQSALLRCDYCGRFVFLAGEEAANMPSISEAAPVRPVRRKPVRK